MSIKNPWYNDWISMEDKVINIYLNYLSNIYRSTLAPNFDRYRLLDKVMWIEWDSKNAPCPEILKLKPWRIKTGVRKILEDYNFEKYFNIIIDDEFSKNIKPKIFTFIENFIIRWIYPNIDDINKQILSLYPWATLNYINDKIVVEYRKWINVLRNKFDLKDLVLTKDVKLNNSNTLQSDNIKIDEILDNISFDEYNFPRQYEELKNQLEQIIEWVEISRIIENLDFLNIDNFISNIKSIYNESDIWKLAISELVSNTIVSILNVKDIIEVLRQNKNIVYYDDFISFKNNKFIDNIDYNQNSIFNSFDKIFSIVSNLLKNDKIKSRFLSHKNIEDIWLTNFEDIEDFYNKFKTAIGIDTALFNIFEIYTVLKLVNWIIDLKNYNNKFLITLDWFKFIRITNYWKNYLDFYRNVWNHKSWNLEIDLLIINYESRNITLFDSKFTTSNIIVRSSLKFENKFKEYYENFSKIILYDSHREYLEFIENNIKKLWLDISSFKLNIKDNKWIIAVWSINKLVNDENVQRYFLPIERIIWMYDFLWGWVLNVEKILWVKKILLINFQNLLNKFINFILRNKI